MTPKRNGKTQHRGLTIEHADAEEGVSQVCIWRTLDSDKSASLGLAYELGTFNDDEETPLTRSEIHSVGVIVDAYEKAGLF